MSSPRKPGVKSEIILGVSILVGLFFVEYPLIFPLGYWSWGALAHKTLTGMLLVLNLLMAQYATKRLGFLSVRRADEEELRRSSRDA